ncbi:4Fe-4S dicluster domain-containing protein [Anaerostipes faecis]|uniref:4Fe-4S dicluster domain-containing protein n=1 Tax=Anaerostipes faecis TaxID=2880702 RepID=UPI00265B332C|nr:4Fe-4S dicluster domain-containing protein [Anaerostipes faecis]
MEISKVTEVFFSPTYSTERIVRLIGEAWEETHQEIELSRIPKEGEVHEFGAQDLVIFGVPSYGGRVPAPAAERFRNLKGQKTPIILLTAFGNRDYDDTLLEMKDLAEEQGFVPAAAVAAGAEHSIMRQYAEGRPDSRDKSELTDFAVKIREKIEQTEDTERVSELSVKGNRPYREYNGVPMKPSAGKQCKKCGLCARLCPAGAIPAEHPEETVKKMCISCMRCIAVCPEHARSISRPMLLAASMKLKKECSERKRNELII